MVFEHLEFLEVDDLLVLHKGHPARWQVAYLIQQQIAFCMRVDETGFGSVKTFLNVIQFVEGAARTRPKHPKSHRKHAYKLTC